MRPSVVGVGVKIQQDKKSRMKDSTKSGKGLEVTEVPQLALADQVGRIISSLAKKRWNEDLWDLKIR